MGDKFENEHYYILSNTISRPKYGIDIQTTYGTLVQDNTIEDLRNSSGLLKNYGIRSLNCYKPVISSNTITPVPFNGNQPGASSDINTGIQIENTWAATLNCNVIRKTGTSLVIAGANPMATITNNDFIKSYYGIYTKNSGYTGDLGNATHPADNQWVGILNSRQLQRQVPGLPEIMYCRTGNAFWPFSEQGDPYIPTLVSSFPGISICPQQIIIDPIEKAQKTVTHDMFQIPTEQGQWVKKGMNKVIKNNPQLETESLLSLFVDTLSSKATGLLDSVLVLREAEMTSGAMVINQNVIPESVMDELEKEINEYLLFTETFGFEMFSVATVDRIREIAAMCPFTEGEAVYKARIMAAYFDPFETEYTNICESEMEDRSAITSENTGSEQILAVPNPSPGSFSLISESLDGSGTLKVFDLSGRCVWEGNATVNERIEMSTLSDGMYYYLFLIGNNSYVGSISIVKE
ncbi:hypothetical protein DSECCO2_610320 [anaerobic digester metagenome]